MQLLGTLLLLVISYIVWKKSSDNLDSADRRVGITGGLISAIVLYGMQELTGEVCVSVRGGWTFVNFLMLLIIPFIHYRTEKNENALENDVKYIAINSRRDILIALYMVSFLLGAQYVLRYYFVVEYTAFLLLILSGIVIFIPLVQLIHYKKYGKGISDATILSVQSTRLQESLEYLLSLAGKYNLVIVLLVISYSMYIAYYYFLWTLDEFYPSRYIEVVLGITVIILYAIIKEIPKTFLGSMWIAITAYRRAEQSYLPHHGKIYDKLKVNADDAMLKKTPGCVILVIGESASRDYMHVYNAKYSYDNTPWLEKMSKSDNIVVFDNAFASYNITMEVLKMALTEASQYNEKKFEDSVSIIDIARKIGYNTYWFSHQGRLGQGNVASTMVASTADAYYGPESVSGINYDKDLLALLKDVDGSQNNFIVIHLMGSHSYYKSRYPAKWTKFMDDTREGHYANTIRYTDEFLEECFEYAKKNLNLQSMIYFSDHGENIQKGHHPSIRTPDTIRIPMFMYMSDEYSGRYPERVYNIRKNKSEFYSNDMLYNTMVGLLNVKTDHYDSKEDISSKDYAYNEESVMTFLGTEKAKKFL